MLLRNLPPLALLACWAVMFAGLFVMWRLLPTGLSQISVLILVIVATVVGYRGNVLPTVYTTALIGLALINYVQASFALAPIVGSVAVFLLIVLITWIKNQFHSTSVGRLEAVLLAFFVSQANSIASLWPVSFYNRALIVGLVFYLFWHIFEQRDDGQVKLAGHFVFVGIIAILILGSIIWANFPQLLSF
ncbi:MAG: hypothetical protein WD970_00880 [Patescibacteria group bacterium]